VSPPQFFDELIDHPAMVFFLEEFRDALLRSKQRAVCNPARTLWHPAFPGSWRVGLFTYTVCQKTCFGKDVLSLFRLFQGCLAKSLYLLIKLREFPLVKWPPRFRASASSRSDSFSLSLTAVCRLRENPERFGCKLIRDGEHDAEINKFEKD
jgi:hypothetical protein